MTTPSLARPKDFRSSSRRLLRLLRSERLPIACASALAGVTVTLTVLGPRLLGRATDLVFGGSAHGRHRVDFAEVGRTLLLVLMLYGLATVFSLAQGRLVTAIVQRAMFRLRSQAQAKLSRLPLSFFDKQPRGEVLSRVTNDIDNLSQTLQQTLSQILNALLSIVGVLAMMILISPLLALIALTTVPLSIYGAARIGRWAKPQFVRQWSTTGRLNAHIEEMYTGHALVKVFGRQQEAAERFREYNDELYRVSLKAQFVSNLARPVTIFLQSVTYLVVAIVGGLRVASGALSLGDVQAFLQYSQQFGQPLTQVASMANLLQSGIASAERVFALLDAREQDPDPAEPKRPHRIQGRIEFDRVSFRYSPDKPLIDDLTVTVRPGQTVAIVGPTGAGKTTLVNLLMRFYDIASGRITLDGTDIATLTRDDLRAKTGMVLQDTWLFGGTIADNIAYGAPHATRDQIQAAARATHLDHFVRTLPDGYDTVLNDDATVLNDDATNISAGERQLITIARAFLADPAILILDEATSSVDTRTEVLIQRAMNNLRQGRTSFVIAHRLSTIRDADLILVMRDGTIVEQGTHDQLLLTGGAYARLYAAQFAGSTAA